MSTAAYPNAEVIFHEQYRLIRRDEVVGVLLALFLGGFGVHHFYLRRVGLGILYLCFSWTPLPWFLGFIECFFMPGRVREFNAIQAAAIAASLGIAPPYGAYNQSWTGPSYPAYTPQPAAATTDISTLIACPRCRNTNPPGSRFCGSCGASLS